SVVLQVILSRLRRYAVFRCLVYATASLTNQKLVKNTISSLKSAPDDFSEAEETVHSLDILLDSLTSEIKKPDSIFQRDPAQDEKFSALVGLCVESLETLCGILDKTPSLGSS